MTAAALRPAACAICLVDGEVDELYPATVTLDDYTPERFSARRLPDRVHHRIVRCRTCGLVRSSPVAEPEVLTGLYRESTFDYGLEVPNLVRTYGRYLRRAMGGRPGALALLEVGCGNGFMLAEALQLGFTSVTGIEPSRGAVERAKPDVRPSVICDVLRPGLLEDGQFDVACLFQVFDHLPDPGAALDHCRDALKPGGSILLFNHNVSAISARLLGRRSPIIDLEHTYLYDPVTLAALCRAKGLMVDKAGSAWNWCSLSYLAHLLPLPGSLKRAAFRALRLSRLGRLNLLLPLGNLYVIARKPARVESAGGTQR